MDRRTRRTSNDYESHNRRHSLGREHEERRNSHGQEDERRHSRENERRHSLGRENERRHSFGREDDQRRPHDQEDHRRQSHDEHHTRHSADYDTTVTTSYPRGRRHTDEHNREYFKNLPESINYDYEYSVRKINDPHTKVGETFNHTYKDSGQDAKRLSNKSNPDDFVREFIEITARDGQPPVKEDGHAHLHKRWAFNYKDVDPRDLAENKLPQKCGPFQEAPISQQTPPPLPVHGPNAPQTKVPMKTEMGQTSCALMPTPSTIVPIIKEKEVIVTKIEYRDREPPKKNMTFQAIQTSDSYFKVKQNTRQVQTSAEKLSHEVRQVVVSKRDENTSTSFIVQDNAAPMGRHLMGVPNSHTQKEDEEYEWAGEEVPELEEENAYPPASAVKPRLGKSLENLCPICETGYYVTQVSFTGCLASILCLLCGGPCWCRHCCDITVCDFCGCSKGFFRAQADHQKAKIYNL